ncbi:MAG: DUF5916 domain-containing protein [Gemmatimonadaceae bacterium]
MSLACVATHSGTAQVPRAVTHVTWTTAAMHLDGVLDEAAWATADTISDLRQIEPIEGEPGSEHTVVRFLATREGLWVGAWLYDREPSRILHAQLRRDGDVERDDLLIIGIDSRRDNRSGFLFAVNPNGTVADAEILSFESTNKQWDGVWDARARITADGWVAEMMIPWQTLRYPAGAAALHVNVSRRIPRKNEELLWQAWRRTEGLNFLERYGVLDGLHDLPGRATVELRPYGVFKSELTERDYEAGGAVITPARTIADAGLDAKLAVARTLTLDLTYNTDFAQAEVDRQVVNLTRFPTFFPETRPFFLESSGIFEFGRLRQTQLFDSRRIGLDTLGQSVPIIGGARLTGRAGAEQVGLLAIRTGGHEDATDVVARVKHDVLGRGYVGAMAVVQDRLGVGSSSSGGVDFNLPYIVHGQNLVFLGTLAVDRSDGKHPSAGYGRFVIDYPNDHADIAVRFDVIGDGFQPALGFVEQSGISRIAGQIELMPRPHRFGIRKFTFSLPSWNWVRYTDGSLSNARIEVRPFGAVFENGASVELNLQRYWDVPRASFELFPGTNVAAGRYAWDRVEAQVETPPARAVRAQITASAGDFYDARGESVEFGVFGRAQPHALLGIEGVWQRIHGLDGTSFIARVGRVRLDYAVNPRLGATCFAQYDNESGRFALNARLRWTRAPGSDAYLVWNSAWPTDLADGIPWRSPAGGAFIAKYVHYFRR